MIIRNLKNLNRRPTYYILRLKKIVYNMQINSTNNSKFQILYNGNVLTNKKNNFFYLFILFKAITGNTYKKS